MGWGKRRLGVHNSFSPRAGKRGTGRGGPLGGWKWVGCLPDPTWAILSEKNKETAGFGNRDECKTGFMGGWPKVSAQMVKGNRFGKRARPCS